MSKSTKPLSVGDILGKFRELIDIFDELIKDDLDINRNTYKEVRNGINDSRRKLIYQFNGGQRLASEVEIFTPESLEKLRQAIEKAKKEDLANSR